MKRFQLGFISACYSDLKLVAIVCGEVLSAEGTSEAGSTPQYQIVRLLSSGDGRNRRHLKRARQSVPVLVRLTRREYTVAYAKETEYKQNEPVTTRPTHLEGCKAVEVVKLNLVGTGTFPFPLPFPLTYLPTHTVRFPFRFGRFDLQICLTRFYFTTLFHYCVLLYVSIM